MLTLAPVAPVVHVLGHAVVGRPQSLLGAGIVVAETMVEQVNTVRAVFKDSGRYLLVGKVLRDGEEGAEADARWVIDGDCRVL